MSKFFATLIVCIATLALGGCADRAKESRQGTGMDKGSAQTSPDSGSRDADTSALENCVTAVGADRKNCTAK